MPNCKNCGSRLSRFDKDICPVCGFSKPLDGVETNTVDITTEIQSVKGEFANYKTKSRVVTAIWSILLGWTGAPFYYLKYYFAGAIYSLISVFLMGGLFAIFYLFASLDLFISIIIPVGIIYFINLVVGIVFLHYHDLKDGNGEFLK